MTALKERENGKKDKSCVMCPQLSGICVEEYGDFTALNSENYISNVEMEIMIGPTNIIIDNIKK